MSGLVILGAGGLARETAQAVLDDGRRVLLGHLDDNPALHGGAVDGVPVLGGCDLVHQLPSDVEVVACVGSPGDYASRARLVRRLGLPRHRYATVVHPTAVVSRSSSVGPGSVLLAHTVLTAAVTVGAHVAVMPHTVLTHDDVVEDFATIASGVRLGGSVRISRGAYLGAGALVREGVTVGAWSLVGMGSAVLGDVPPGQTWVGVPARARRRAPDSALDEVRTERIAAEKIAAERIAAAAEAGPAGPIADAVESQGSQGGLRPSESTGRTGR
ncbi:acetyltransferase [Streptacidiphilus sp. EB129]|uniref:acetyltransferase n=1 Tax=Streptacidiphilus sp. EB129 TaxID=3156262 RepID=UPI003511FEA5